MIGRYIPKHVRTPQSLCATKEKQSSHEIGPLHMHLLVFYLLSYLWSGDFEDVHIAVLVHERPWEIEQGRLERYVDLREDGRVNYQSKS